MASMWRRAMLYLGLGPDDEYDDYEYDEPASGRPSGASSGRASAPMPVGEPPEVQVTGTVRTLPPQSGDPGPNQGVAPVVRARPAVVRPVPNTPSAKPYTVAPTSFNEAQEIADKYKSLTPVIVNLQDVDRELSRRIIDFASGLCYGLGGTMDRVANQVYLLTPSNVEVSAEERRRLHDRGLHD
jgi:cell division inhibitor SepF